jgi:hypothetical protein
MKNNKKAVFSLPLLKRKTLAYVSYLIKHKAHNTFSYYLIFAFIRVAIIGLEQGL